MAKAIIRCSWCGDDPLYQSYHDEEWGVTLKEDQKLFEFLTLESAQAGLSWITILRKRTAYREAFADFDPEVVAGFSSKQVEELLGNAGIVRNRKKIEAAINNAARFLEVSASFGSFYNYSMRFVGGQKKVNRFKNMQDVPAITEESTAFAKDLKQRGFKFLGPTTVYAHMQACGMVNDHMVDCFRYSQV